MLITFGDIFNLIIIIGHMFNMLFAYALFGTTQFKRKKRWLNFKVVLGANAVVVIMFFCTIFNFFENHFVSQILSALILFVLIFLSIVHFLGLVEYGDSVGWYESYGRELYFIITTHYTLLAMFMIAMPFFIFISENGATSLCTAIMFCLFGW